MVKTAIHAGVWSSDTNPESVREVLAEVNATGFDALAIPLRNLPNLQVGKLAAAFAEAGIIALGTTGLPRNCDVSSADAEERKRGEAHLQAVMSMARDIGIIQVGGVIYSLLGHAGQPAGSDQLRRSAESVARIAEVAERCGVRLCVEIVNRYETAMLNSVAQGLDYLELAGHRNLRLHLDTYHMAIEEPDPAAAARAALPVLGYFELDQSHRGRLDEGSLDLRAMSSPLQKAGYDGFLGVEAFARSRLAPDHANTLSIWRDHFEHGTALAQNAIALIRDIFGPNV